ncbi:MAG: DUF4292 domain-containing protein [Sphingobacteriaceae bacterium]|nr:DUF4292 domain-containing protein [Sphingobacteriaceae bacterium]
MKRNILNSTVLLLSLSLLFACRTKKQAVLAPPAKVAVVDSLLVKKEENIRLLQSKNLKFNTLSLKAKVNLNIDNQENRVTMNVKIERDKKIWVNVIALGIAEIARVLITPDSVFVLNRTESVAFKKPFSYLHGFVSKKVDFKMLQSVFVANTIDDFLTSNTDLKNEMGLWNVKNQEMDLACQIIFNTLLKPNELFLNDVKAAQSLKISYPKYTNLNSDLFPSVMEVKTAFGTKKINIDFEFFKIEQDVAVEFPFTIPKRFKIIR